VEWMRLAHPLACTHESAGDQRHGYTTQARNDVTPFRAGCGRTKIVSVGKRRPRSSAPLGMRWVRKRRGAAVRLRPFCEVLLGETWSVRCEDAPTCATWSAQYKEPLYG
jgi:hypothetical protein